MANINGSSTPGAGATTTLYTGLGTETISTISICNTGATATTITIWRVPNGGSTATENKMIATATIDGYDTWTLTIGITPKLGDTIQVSSVSGTVNFFYDGKSV